MQAFKPPSCFDYPGLLRGSGFHLTALMFIALFVPARYKEVKGGPLLCTLRGMAILACKRELDWSRPTVLACGLFAAVGPANAVHGYFKPAPGATRQADRSIDRPSRMPEPV